MASHPSIGVALGSGAARGIAHISYIEALDEMGLVPTIIAGSSIGALLGAAWASGMAGKELREHAVRMATPQGLVGNLWQWPSPQAMLESGLSVQVDARHAVEVYLPASVPQNIEDLKIPFEAVATDYYGWSQKDFSVGPLRPAVAASIAIPGVFRPVRIDGTFYIDGGMVNPLPIDRVRDRADVVIAIDVNGAPLDPQSVAEPNPFEVGFIANEIMTDVIIRQSRILHPANVYVHAPARDFRVLEFWRAAEIVAAADAEKDAFKRAVSQVLEQVEREGRGPTTASDGGAPGG